LPRAREQLAVGDGRRKRAGGLHAMHMPGRGRAVPGAWKKGGRGGSKRASLRDMARLPSRALARGRRSRPTASRHSGAAAGHRPASAPSGTLFA
jgi:hypothetical protein